MGYYWTEKMSCEGGRTQRTLHIVQFEEMDLTITNSITIKSMMKE